MTAEELGKKLLAEVEEVGLNEVCFSSLLTTMRPTEHIYRSSTRCCGTMFLEKLVLVFLS